MSRPELRFSCHWNQWLVGFMLDYGRILPIRWLVFIVGPFSLSVSAGRKELAP